MGSDRLEDARSHRGPSLSCTVAGVEEAVLGFRMSPSARRSTEQDRHSCCSRPIAADDGLYSLGNLMMSDSAVEAFEFCTQVATAHRLYGRTSQMCFESLSELQGWINPPQRELYRGELWESP